MHHATRPRLRMRAMGLALVLCLSACSITQVKVSPPLQTPVCAAQLHARVLWTSQWRPDQKEPALREQAAQRAIEHFFQESGCFAQTTVQHIAPNALEQPLAQSGTDTLAYGKTLLITVRELGPVLRVGASMALVEGGTEVVLDVQEYLPHLRQPARQFRVHRLEGGPGVVRGVSHLDHDMEAALRAALQASPPGATR